MMMTFKKNLEQSIRYEKKKKFKKKILLTCKFAENKFSLFLLLINCFNTKIMPETRFYSKNFFLYVFER